MAFVAYLANAILLLLIIPLRASADPIGRDYTRYTRGMQGDKSDFQQYVNKYGGDHDKFLPGQSGPGGSGKYMPGQAGTGSSSKAMDYDSYISKYGGDWNKYMKGNTGDSFTAKYGGGGYQSFLQGGDKGAAGGYDKFMKQYAGGFGDFSKFIPGSEQSQQEDSHDRSHDAVELVSSANDKSGESKLTDFMRDHAGADYEQYLENRPYAAEYANFVRDWKNAQNRQSQTSHVPKDVDFSKFEVAREDYEKYLHDVQGQKAMNFKDFLMKYGGSYETYLADFGKGAAGASNYHNYMSQYVGNYDHSSRKGVPVVSKAKDLPKAQSQSLVENSPQLLASAPRPEKIDKDRLEMDETLGMVVSIVFGVAPFTLAVMWIFFGVFSELCRGGKPLNTRADDYMIQLEAPLCEV
eukprot:TRINITY_DN18213_c1_g2_i1.p1 TRINITY_DN18213_c1_g2~~TRINITY_DN18213_c1_g2_i1.p1  ORF type:complete len:408 (-),score=80.10 TRINITY_DN18213_c1_g2_i1:54-1277(-)